MAEQPPATNITLNAAYTKDCEHQLGAAPTDGRDPSFGPWSQVDMQRFAD